MTGWGHIFDMIGREKANQEMRIKYRNKFKQRKKSYLAMMPVVQGNYCSLTKEEKEQIKHRIKKRNQRYYIYNIVSITITLCILMAIFIYLQNKYEFFFVK